jgi:hypothetical protein
MKRHPIEARIDKAVAKAHELVIGHHAPKSWGTQDDARLLRSVLAARTGRAPLEQKTNLLEDDLGNALVRRNGCIGAVPGDGYTTYFDLLFADGALVSCYYGHDYGHPGAYYLHAPTAEALDEVAALVRVAAVAAGLELHDDPIQHTVPRSRVDRLFVI